MDESGQLAGTPLSRLPGLVPDASFAVARDVQRFTFGIVRSGARFSTTVVGVVARTPVVRWPLEAIETQVDTLAQRGAEQRRADQLQTTSIMSSVEPFIVQVLERVVALLPVNALLARVDINALLTRVDVNAIIARVDLETVVGEVLSGIEFGDLIHDSTTSIVTDVRDTVRGGAATADSKLARIVDRFTRRQRDVILPGYALPTP